jgi:hypothetical protein
MTDRPVHLIVDPGALAHAVTDATAARGSTDPADVTCPVCQKIATTNRPTLTPEPNRPDRTLEP